MIDCNITNDCPSYTIGCESCSRNLNNKGKKIMLVDIYKQETNKEDKERS